MVAVGHSLMTNITTLNVYWFSHMINAMPANMDFFETSIRARLWECHHVDGGVMSNRLHWMQINGAAMPVALRALTQIAVE
jgi:hypothetical protein